MTFTSYWAQNLKKAGVSSGISLWLFSLVLCLCLSLATGWTRKYKSRLRTIREHGCEPPLSLPQRDPVFGLDVALNLFSSYYAGKRSADFKAQHEKYGPTFQSRALGKTRIFTIEPENLRAILSRNFKDWGVQPLRLRPWGPLLGAGVMDTDGPFWRHSRNVVQPLFHHEQVADLRSFNKHVSQLLQLIPKDGSTVDLQPLFARLIFDFTTEFLFGDCCDSLAPAPNEASISFLEAFHYGQAGIGKRTQLPYLSVFTTDRKFWQAAKTVRDYVDEYINRAASRCSANSANSATYTNNHTKKKHRYILADQLIATHTDRTDIRNQLLNTFLAAHDTTAVLITNVFFHLSRHPAAYSKLRSELLASTSDRPAPNIKDAAVLKSLPYLHDCVNETSRLTPVVGQSARIALADTVLPKGGGPTGGSPTFVRRGTSVQFNFFALHRRSEVYGPRAEEWIPERWEWESVKEKVGAWDFLPFIGGPRVCPAREMAVLQVKFVVASLVREFERLECRDEVWEFVERYRITADSRNGCKVGVVG